MESTAVDTIKGLFDLGGVVVVTVMLWIVWRRLNDVTDKLIDILEELRMQRVAPMRVNESPWPAHNSGKTKDNET